MTAPPSETSPRRYPAPALFGVLVLPFGAAVGFLQIAVPFWLAKLGMPLAQIGALSATAFLPHALKIFWIPLIDLTGRRKVWYLVCGNLVAALLAAASLIRNPLEHYGLYVFLLTALQAAAATTAASLNALMATTPRESDKGRAGGFYMAGNVGGTSVLGAMAIWLGRNTGATTAGLVLAGLMVLSTLGAFTLQEVPGEGLGKAGASALGTVLRRFGAIVMDLVKIVFSVEGLTGLLICLAPVGCGALTNLFSALAEPYAVPDGMVEWVNGLGMGITGALGSILGGFLSDKMNRRLAYALAGGLTAVCALGMGLAPMTTTTYVAGTLAYSFANGIAFAAFAGMVLEIVSKGAVATKYAAFVAVSNLAISYNTWLDSAASTFRNWGVRGTLLADAGITFAGICFLLVMVLVTRLVVSRAAEPKPALAPPA
jgi:MFS family permease